jgi:hypothetical protein
MSELLRCHLSMAVGAQAADVVVGVGATQGERLDVVWYSGSGRSPGVPASSTYRLGIEPALALALPRPAPQALGHAMPLI